MRLRESCVRRQKGREWMRGYIIYYTERSQLDTTNAYSDKLLASFYVLLSISFALHPSFQFWSVVSISGTPLSPTYFHISLALHRSGTCNPGRHGCCSCCYRQVRRPRRVCTKVRAGSPCQLCSARDVATELPTEDRWSCPSHKKQMPQTHV